MSIGKILIALGASLVAASLFIATPAKATNYYISSVSGDDADAGTTDPLAVKTLDVGSALLTTSADRLYLKCNESWPLEDIRLSISGVTLGAYWMDGATPTPVTSSVGCPSGESKPTISGAFTSDAAEGTFPAIWKPLVWIREDYITVQDIKIINSSYSAIEVDNNWSYAVIQRLDMSHISHSAVIFEGGSSLNILRDSTMYQVVLSRVLGFSTGYGGCIKIASGSSQNLIENNTVSDCGGDGVNPYNNSNKNIIKGNYFLGIAKGGVYIDNSSDTIIEDNFIAGGTSGTYNWTRTDYGIKIGVEDIYTPINHSTGNVARNNFIANVRECFTTGAYPASIAAGKTAGFHILGNTCVGFDEIANQVADNDSYAAGSTVANNVFHESSLGASACDAKGTVANVTWGYNHFDYTQTTTECNGTGDAIAVAGPPLYTTASFLSYGVLNVPTIADFGLDTSGSNTASNAGDPRVAVVLTASDYPLRTEITGNWDDTHSVKALYYDYEGLARNATTPDMGALEPGSEAPDAAESRPFHMDVGGTGCTGTITYETDQYYTGTGYTTTITDAVTEANGDTCMYLNTRGAGTTGNWTVPIDCSAGCDVTLKQLESYWGDEAGTCMGGERTYSITVEGTVYETNYDICLQTQAVNKADLYVIPNVVTGGDNILNIVLGQGTTAPDTKWQLSGISIIDHTSTNTLVLATTTPTASNIVNLYTAATELDVVSLTGAATTTENNIVIQGALNTASLTCGTAVVSTSLNSIEYTPANAGANSIGCGTISFTLADGEDTEAVTLTIGSIIKEKNITAYITSQRYVAEVLTVLSAGATSGWTWCVWDYNPTTEELTDTVRQKPTSFCSDGGGGVTLASDGGYTIIDARLPAKDTLIEVEFKNSNAISIGGVLGIRDLFSTPVQVRQ